MNMKQNITIRDKEITPKGPSFIIAEAGVNHNGEIDRARELVQVARDAAADAIKFQIFYADKLVTRQAEQAAYQTQNLGKKETQYEMLKRLELPDQAFAELKTYAESLGLIFMATPFDKSAIDFLYELGVYAYKVGSGDLTNIPYLSHMAKTGIPMIVSTGMSVIEEVMAAKMVIASAGNDQLVFLHCTSNYPCPYEETNLRAMNTLRRETGCLVGYSDHTEGIVVPSTAVAMGAVVIEKHFTTDRNLPGPDHKASLEPEELKEMVRQIRLIETIMGEEEKKPTAAELEVAKVARKSVVALVDIPAHTTITADMLTIKRPGTGISPSKIHTFLGKKTKQYIPAETLLSWDMIQ